MPPMRIAAHAFDERVKIQRASAVRQPVVQPTDASFCGMTLPEKVAPRNERLWGLWRLQWF